MSKSSRTPVLTPPEQIPLALSSLLELLPETLILHEHTTVVIAESVQDGSGERRDIDESVWLVFTRYVGLKVHI